LSARRGWQVGVSFVIESWAACAPGLETAQRWWDWAVRPWLPHGEPRAALASVAPLLRRRFAPLGRLAAEVVFELPQGHLVPTVFASRYGEAGRCLELLAEHARGDALSPTAFGLSVHNAIGAMVAIARGDQGNSTAIAAGRATAAAGVCEALGLIDDGADRADLVVYDAPLPPTYSVFEDEPTTQFAWAWRLRRPRAGEQPLRLDWDDAAPASSPIAPMELPAALQPLWFALSSAPLLEQVAGDRLCRWSRDV
jgi:Beta-ketoacyl synthase, N-terminal domain